MLQPSASADGSLASRLRGTCQWGLRMSKEDHEEPETSFRDSLMQGSEYESFLVTLFNDLLSIQNPFFRLYLVLICY